MLERLAPSNPPLPPCQSNTRLNGSSHGWQNAVGRICVVVNANGDDNELIFPLVNVVHDFLVEFFEGRLAWSAPSGPKVEEYNFATPIAEFGGFAIGQLNDVDLRRHVSSLWQATERESLHFVASAKSEAAQALKCPLSNGVRLFEPFHVRNRIGDARQSDLAGFRNVA